jgi:hypothetical protein
MPKSDYRKELQLLFDAAESFVEPALGHHRPWAKAMDRARAALDAQPEPVAPTDEELISPIMWMIDECVYDTDKGEIAESLRELIACWGNSQGILDSSPQPVWADIHYAWELEDADGEWQAGGSANSLEDVQREGNRYLQTYLQDGPHKLIIQRHCVNTIEEVTNG